MIIIHTRYVLKLMSSKAAILITPGRRAQHRMRGSRSQKGSQQSSSPTPRLLHDITITTTRPYYDRTMTMHNAYYDLCSPAIMAPSVSTLVAHQGAVSWSAVQLVYSTPP